jgi:hypothetical protein
MTSSIILMVVPIGFIPEIFIKKPKIKLEKGLA